MLIFFVELSSGLCGYLHFQNPLQKHSLSSVSRQDSNPGYLVRSTNATPVLYALPVILKLMFLLLDFLKQEVMGFGLFYVSCPSDWFLLSCGTESTVMGKFDPMIYALAFDAQTCECYNIYGMKCSAWCTDKPLTDQGHQITLVGNSTTDSICPYGSKMISCSRKPMLTSGSNINFFTNYNI